VPLSAPSSGCRRDAISTPAAVATWSEAISIVSKIRPAPAASKSISKEEVVDIVPARA